MKKRILALLLTLAMLLTIVPAAVLADDAEGAAAETAAASENPFKDMTNGSVYYYKPVFWAVDNGITTGKTADTFAPENLCTRGQVVTFLYRAAGSPKVSGSNPFEDVKEGSYCYNAVIWAVANGITTGKDATHFGPDLMCTRGQVVTFMYRAAGSPKVSASNPFTDVAEDSYCYDAVLWAVANGITSGKTATTFAPNEGCTRAQVVTFLYRGAGSPPVDAPAPYVAPAPDYGGLYADQLNKMLSATQIFKNDSRFALVYIDNDDIPEMVVGVAYSSFSGAYVFSIRNNTVVELVSHSGSFGEVYFVPKSGRFFTEHSQMNVIHTYISTMSGGQLTSTHTLYKNSGTYAAQVKSFAYDDVVISESTYNSYYNSMINAYNWTSFGCSTNNGMKVTASNISALRSDWTKALLK